MSFKIFSLQVTGKIKSVEKIESQRKNLEADFKEFNKVDESDELKEFIALESWMKSDELKNEKARIAALQFKGSETARQLVEFEKLKKKKSIKNYFKVKDSTNLKNFYTVEKSEKLKEFERLTEFVKKGDFEEEKKKIEKQVFKGSKEQNKLNELKRLKKSAAIKAFLELDKSQLVKNHEQFSNSEKLKTYIELKNKPALDKETSKKLKKLKKDSEIKKYFKTEKAKKYKLYKQTVGSVDLNKYTELVKIVDEKEFKEQLAYLKDKNKFKKTEAWKKGIQQKKLAADSEIKFYQKFGKSALYKNYLDVKDSVELKRFEELQQITTSKEWLERKTYLEDKKKWEKTDEYKKELRYHELKKLPHLIKYFKYKNSTDFDFIRNWELSFEDDFSAPALNKEKWLTTSFIGDKFLGGNYSMPGDLHVFTNGSNLALHKKLTIQVKKEKKEAKIWKTGAGFVSAELDYTSGLVSTGKSFWQEDGVFEAKIKFSPVKQVVSTFYLSGEENVPRVNLLEMGAKNRIGISTIDKNGKVVMQGEDISNLKKGNFYIFTVEKSGSNFTWKINETEIVSLNDSRINYPLHLNANSIVMDELTGSMLPVNFEIEWVKCYRKK